MAKSKWLVVGLFLLLPFAALIKPQASSSGINGFSGDPATGGLTCNKCHSGGATPSVTLSGPTLVQPGPTVFDRQRNAPFLLNRLREEQRRHDVLVKP